MAKDKKPRRPRIRQNARVITNTTGPIEVRGVTAYDEDDNPITRVGVEVPDEDDE